MDKQTDQQRDKYGRLSTKKGDYCERAWKGGEHGKDNSSIMLGVN